MKALIPLWLPWARRRWRLSATVCQQLRTISPRQMDRRLAPTKRQLQTRRYGRTKPGTLLKHHIPLKTDHWDVTVPGFGRLGMAGVPRWLDGDLIGALTALTGERFGYNLPAWREWWARRPASSSRASRRTPVSVR